MKLRHFLAAAIVLSSFSPARGSYTHDIATTQLVSPSLRVLVDTATKFVFRFTNQGSSSETGVQVAFALIDYYGVVQVRDTEVLPQLTPGQHIDTAFGPYTPTTSTFKVIARTLLGTDENSSNDELDVILRRDYEANVEADSISQPPNGGAIAPGLSIQPTAYFKVTPFALDVFDIPVRIQIRRCSDGRMVFQSDTVMPQLYAGQSAVPMVFPSRQGQYDFRNILKGCYQVYAISRYGTDGDHTNDTAKSTFSIGSHLLGNDVAVDSALQPSPNTQWVPHVASSISFRFENVGRNDQTVVEVLATIVDNSGLVVYRDSQLISSWTAGSIRDVSFKPFIPTRNGGYTITAQTLLANDEYQPDDTARMQFGVGASRGVLAVDVTSPRNGDTLIRGIGAPVTATFTWINGFPSGSKILARLDVHDRRTNKFMIEIDAAIPWQSGYFPITFPSRTVNPGLESLPNGDYDLAVSAVGADDSTFNTSPLHIFVHISGRFDLSVDSIIAPRNDSTIALGDSVSPLILITNRGLYRESNARLAVTATGATTIRTDTIELADLEKGASVLVKSPKFTYADRGMIDLVATCAWNLDSSSENDTKQAIFPYGMIENDARCQAIRRPLANADLGQGEAFSPRVSYQWLGAFTQSPPVTLSLRIKDSLGVERFAEDTTIDALPPLAQELEWTFANSNGASSTKDLPVGKYTLVAYCKAQSDAMPGDDTASIQITIDKSPFGVTPMPVQQVVLEAPFPNPANRKTTIEFHNASQRSFTIIIYNVLGSEVGLVNAEDLASNNSKFIVSTAGYPNGVYFYGINSYSGLGSPKVVGSFSVLH